MPWMGLNLYQRGLAYSCLRSTMLSTTRLYNRYDNIPGLGSQVLSYFSKFQKKQGWIVMPRVYYSQCIY